MLYYPEGALDVCTPECSSGCVTHALRDHCTDMNLIASVFTAKKGWCMIPTFAALSTGMDMDRKVLGTIEPPMCTSAFCLKHVVTLSPPPPQEPFVVSNTDFFDLLMGNCPMTLVADSLTQFPITRLHVYPNLIELTGYVITIPLTKGPLSHFCTATCRFAFSSLCSGTACLT